jgi:hypothetical protein
MLSAQAEWLAVNSRQEKTSEAEKRFMNTRRCGVVELGKRTGGAITMA